MAESEGLDDAIVGAGAAGCVLANRLTKNVRQSLCLLEACPPEHDLLLHIPAGLCKTSLRFIAEPNSETRVGGDLYTIMPQNDNVALVVRSGLMTGTAHDRAVTRILGDKFALVLNRASWADACLSA